MASGVSPNRRSLLVSTAGAVQRLRRRRSPRLAWVIRFVRRRSPAEPARMARNQELVGVAAGLGSRRNCSLQATKGRQKSWSISTIIANIVSRANTT